MGNKKRNKLYQEFKDINSESKDSKVSNLSELVHNRAAKPEKSNEFLYADLIKLWEMADPIQKNFMGFVININRQK